MKKVGILNFHSSNSNYGAVLQAVALQESLKSFGYDSENINLIPPVMSGTAFKILLRKFKKQVKVILGRDYYVRGGEVFQLFRNEFLRVTDSKFYTLNQLEEYPFSYDSIIVGSDQVWRPFYTKTLAPAYFLSFAKDPIKKIAYAASFGVDHWEDTDKIKFTNSIRTLMHRFHAISVREDSAIFICSQIFQKGAKHVLDPTLLLGREFFQALITGRSDSEEPVITYYKLDRSQDFMDLIRYVELQRGHQSRDIYFRSISRRLKEFIPIKEWLWELSNSSLVITDSFHCVCFAILFEKEFLYYGNRARGLARVESLFRMLNLENRIVSSFKQDEVDSIFANKLDYNAINKRLERLRYSSKQFLLEALTTD